MLLLIQYLVKLSISLAIVWLFYQFVLRKLTFYNSNRWYLLGYTLLCFFIPFIDISPVLQKNEWTDSTAVSWVPVIEDYGADKIASTHSYNFFTVWNIGMLVVIAGMLVMFCRLLIQLLSFRRMMRNAKAIPGENVNLFQVDEEIIPFSFGNSIFINKHLHTTEELQEIIRHEFVHVKQKHSIDIIWGELLCLFNWYNPFAWLLKRSMRQNLEFIADNKVLQNGIDKKQYQYLLLKVIGNNQFSIAPKFNFSSLKKRIAMMNKLKTAKLHLVRFLFILPLLAVILLSFRKQVGDSLSQNKNREKEIATAGHFTDTIPGELNEKGYIIDVVGRKSNATVIVKDKNGKLVERISYSKWKDNEKFYNDKYGELPPPPPLPLPPTPPEPPQPMELPENVTKIDVNNKKATVTLKDGKIEKYDLNKPEEKAAFEKKYGEILPAPPRPPVPPKLPDYVKRIDRNDEFAEVWLKNGTKESYHLKVASENAAFEKKYGDLLQTIEEMPVKGVNPRLSGFLEKNQDVKDLSWVFNNVRENIPVIVYVMKKDGSQEKYKLDDPADKARAEKKYGELPYPDSTPPEWLDAPVEVYELSAAQEVNRANIGDRLEIDEKKATVHLKNGKVEEYNLANEAELKKFETKYGKIIKVGAKGEGVSEPVKVIGHSMNKTGSSEPVTGVGQQINTKGSYEPVTLIGVQGTRAGIAPARIAREGGVTFLNGEGSIISGEEDILVTITKKATQQELEGFIKQMKERGIQLKFNNTKYDNGILVHIDGTMKYKDGDANFSATDFNKLILSMVKNSDRPYMQVRVVDNKKVVI